MFRPTASDHYIHIYSKDPAIDQTAPGYDPVKWTETGDAKYLPVKSGCVPVQFRLRHLDARSRASITDLLAHDEPTQAVVEAISLAVVEILHAELPDGTPVQAEFTQANRDRRRRLTDETLAILYSANNGDLVAELGNRIIGETYGNPT